MSACQRFEIVDLSIPFHVGMPKYEASWFPAFSLSEVSPESMSEAQWKRRFTMLDMFAHNGTHVESPDHAFRDGRTICQYELRRFAGEPTIVDLSGVPEASEIEVEAIAPHLPEPAGDPATDGRILLLRTGYNDRAWGTQEFWKRSPYLSEAAARVVAEAGFGLVGIDFQTEKPGERDFVVHRTLLSRGGLLCEYLVNLHRLRAGALFIAAPVRILGVEASPVRAVALNFESSKVIET